MPLREKAELEKAIGPVEVKRDKTKSSFLNAYESIQKDVAKLKDEFWLQTQTNVMVD